MNKRKFATIAGIFFVAAFIFFLIGRSLFQDTSIKSEATSSHQEHATLPRESGGGPKTLEISPEKQQLIGVKIAQASMRPLRKVIRTVGRIEYDERKLATVNLKVEGWIERLHVNTTGQYVRKGEPLAEIYSPELLSVQLEYLNLLKWRKERSYRFQREVEFSWGDRYGTTGKMQTSDMDTLIQVAQQRMRFWDITDEQMKAVEAKGEPMKTFTIHSPVNGYVVQKPAVQGKRVEPGEKLFDLADLSEVWIIADIYVHELPMIKPGQPARISLSFFPGKEFSSRIDYIYPLLSSETRTAKVRFILPNSTGDLKPQMFAKVEIKIDLGKRLAIPEEAVIDTGERQIVYVDRDGGYFEPREVKLGLMADGMVEVIKGLKAGEKVASSPNFLIDSEAKLKGITQ